MKLENTIWLVKILEQEMLRSPSHQLSIKADFSMGPHVDVTNALHAALQELRENNISL